MHGQREGWSGRARGGRGGRASERETGRENDERRACCEKASEGEREGERERDRERERERATESVGARLSNAVLDRGIRSADAGK